MESRFAAVISEEDKSFDPEALLASIRDQLIAERREMVMKLLGFQTSWGSLNSIQAHAGAAVFRASLRALLPKQLSVGG